MRADLLYRFCRFVVVGFCRMFWRLSVEGLEHVPAGAFILAPVHRSNIDTPLVGIVTRRRLRYMGKDSMWKYKPVGWFFDVLGSFPVRRGTVDREALQRCLEILEAGEVLVLFPEGTRQSGPVVQSLWEGAAYLALRAGVPIVPVGIGGSERAMPKGARFVRPVKVHIVIGPPIAVGADAPAGRRVSLSARRELTDRLRSTIQELFDRAQVRAGA
ncbi:MAG: lysophospholipid acyltransferase family protein [Acidimicrobiales bacterium]